jgi:hypothetical protein
MAFSPRNAAVGGEVRADSHKLRAIVLPRALRGATRGAP